MGGGGGLQSGRKSGRGGKRWQVQNGLEGNWRRSKAVGMGLTGTLKEEGNPPPPPTKGMHWKGRVSQEAVRQAVGGGCQSGWGRLLSVTNAAEAGTWR